MSQLGQYHAEPNDTSAPGILPRRTVASSQGPAVDIPALQAVSRVLQEQSSKDAMAVPDLSELLSIPGRGSSATYSVLPDDHRAPFMRRKQLAIPEEIYDYLHDSTQTWHLGLLPEIERVWLAIDAQLVLWDYVEGKELDAYAEQRENISHVGLVKPKPGVFVEDIHHLLVITTPLSVLLLGIQVVESVASSGVPRKELKLYETNMRIATEVEMTAVAGTADGRIFMTGSQDGHLYELHYQEKESWFGKKIQLVNHSIGGISSLLPSFSKPATRDRILSIVTDQKRGLLYVLSEESRISVYQPAGEKAVHHLQTLSNLFRTAQDRAPGSPALAASGFKIVAIHVIDPSESRSGFQLLAITANGVRLYFSPSQAYGYYGGSSGSTASQLQLLHVRLPPTDLLHPDEQASATKGGQTQPLPLGSLGSPAVAKLEFTCYSAGVTIASQAGDREDRDFLLGLAPELSRISRFGQTQRPQQDSAQYANPASSTVAIGGERAGLVEHATMLPANGRTYAMAAVPHASAQPYTPNELAVQFNEPPRNYLILTNSGVTFFTKRRPVDHLIALLEDYLKDGNSQDILQFQNSFGRDQTCAILLAIAGGNTYLDISTTSLLGSETNWLTADLVNIAKQVFFNISDRPAWSEPSSYSSSGNVKFSGRREGLALYLARLTRPIMKIEIATPRAQLRALEDVLLATQKNLHALKTLFDQSPQLFHSAPGEYDAKTTSSREQEAWKAEEKSVSELQAFLTRTVEAISFVLLIHDHRDEHLFAKVDRDAQKIVSALTFEEFITTNSGITAARALVNVLIDQQISQETGVEAVSDLLQTRCGTFCSTDDVMLYKAKETVRKASETQDALRRQGLLDESLKLFINVARILDFEKLREVIGDYQELNFVQGAVNLPLHVAQAEDADNQGAAFWHAGCPANDYRADVWERRRRCYDLILDSLAVFETRQGDHSQMEQMRDEFKLALNAPDQMFHSVLYDWMLERGAADALVKADPPYLVSHLRREPITTRKYRLLSQYFSVRGEHLLAAEVLGTMADSPGFDLRLEERLECLTRAAGNAKAYSNSESAQSESSLGLLQDLEEKVEVAELQLAIYYHLSARGDEDSDAGRCIRDLSKRLYNVTELYEGVAVPFDIPEFKLRILHVAEHRDENLANSLWNQVFEEALEGAEDASKRERIEAKVRPLGRKLYPSDYAFPVRHVSRQLVHFALANKNLVPRGWAPRLVSSCNVPSSEIWDVWNEMYESQVPPFNEHANVRAVSADIAVFLLDWTRGALHYPSDARDLPLQKIYSMLDTYISELGSSQRETKEEYEEVKRLLQRVR